MKEEIKPESSGKREEPNDNGGVRYSGIIFTVDNMRSEVGTGSYVSSSVRLV